jgi:hypothetical protein
MLLRWQPAMRDVRAARDPVEAGFFDEQAAVDAKVAGLLKEGAGGRAAAAEYLTGLTVSRMEKLVALYRSLRKTLLAKYTGDGV